MEERETIGTLLQRYRSDKNVELEEIAQKTKINISVLRALEEDDLSELPNKTYVRGFVASFAKTVGLNETDAKSALDYTYQVKLGAPAQEDTIQSNLGSLQTKNPVENENEEIKETIISIAQGFFNKKIFYASITLFVIFMIAKGVVNFFSNLNYESESLNKAQTTIHKEVLKGKDENLFDIQATKKLAKDQLQNKKDESKVKKTDTKQIASPVKVDESTKVTEESEEESKEEIQIEEVTTQEPKKMIDGKFPYKDFHPTPRNMYDLISDSEEANNPDILPSNIKSSVTEGKQNVFVKALEGDTWISYQVDDQEIKRYVLKQGRHVLIRGDKILLFLGNFNDSKVFVNNKLVTATAKSSVKSLIFPKSIAKEYVLPLFPTFNGVPYSAKVYKENMAEKSDEKEEENVTQ